MEEIKHVASRSARSLLAISKHGDVSFSGSSKQTSNKKATFLGSPFGDTRASFDAEVVLAMDFGEMADSCAGKVWSLRSFCSTTSLRLFCVLEAGADLGYIFSILPGTQSEANKVLILYLGLALIMERAPGSSSPIGSDWWEGTHIQVQTTRPNHLGDT